MTKKKIARKIATYAMAASMIGGSILGSGITGVSAAEKYPTAKTSYSKTVAKLSFRLVILLMSFLYLSPLAKPFIDNLYHYHISPVGSHSRITFVFSN